MAAAARCHHAANYLKSGVRIHGTVPFISPKSETRETRLDLRKWWPTCGSVTSLILWGISALWHEKAPCYFILVRASSSGSDNWMLMFKYSWRIQNLSWPVRTKTPPFMLCTASKHKMQPTPLKALTLHAQWTHVTFHHPLWFPVLDFWCRWMKYKLPS